MIKIAISQGSMLSLKDVHDAYHSLLEECECEDYRGYRSQGIHLKELIRDNIKSAKFEKPLQMNQSERIFEKEFSSEMIENAIKENMADRMKTLWRAAEILRSDILSISSKFQLNVMDPMSDAADEIPASLLSILRWILVGKRQLLGKRENSIKLVSKNIANVIM